MKRLTTKREICLTSARSVYVTEGFVRQTKKLSSVDPFVEKIAEAIFVSMPEDYTERSVLVETEDKSFSLFFRYGGGRDQTDRLDLMFYKFLSREKSDRTNDRRITAFLEKNEIFSFTVREIGDEVDAREFSKLYRVGEDDKVRFPLLSAEQRAILEIEDKNVLVQGVAGSGKTNLCIEKIVYCAARGYRGRVLYTTYSRGLLVDTKTRVNVISSSVARFIDRYEKGEVLFLDDNHKRAIENRLGFTFAFEKEEYIVDALKKITAFLDKNVDYYLLEDLFFVKHGRKAIADEGTFLTDYLASGRASGSFDKIKNLSPEIVYKEIFGLIYGKYDPENPSDMMTREGYCESRKESFSKGECEAIYSIALDYGKYLVANDLYDNNSLSRALLIENDRPLYSVGVIDETQDFTQVNLFLLRKLCRKLFCVGDAQQMINPSYFSFAYLKRLLYGEITGVAELKHNYRNAKRIENVVEKIGELNVKRFGTHSFVLRGVSVEDGIDATTAYTLCGDFADRLREKRFENLTVVVSSVKKKEALRKKLKNIEILTVSEAKGLERDAVVLIDVLSDSADKWQYLTNMTLNRKTADENSVFRYYHNLFYVGVTRARRNLYVVEKEPNTYFSDLFRECFAILEPDDAVKNLSDISGKTELDDDELTERIEKFCRFGQYENALFTADRLSDELLRQMERTKIVVHRDHVKNGDYRGAGMAYWREGYDDEAKEMFRLSGDEEVIPLVDACRNGGRNLDYQIVKFLPMVEGNPVAREMILETMKEDCRRIADGQKTVKSDLKSQRSKR